jgi:hypothetical protein
MSFRCKSTNQSRYANFCYQPIAGRLLPLQIKEQVSSGKFRKISAMDVNGLSCISSLQQALHANGDVTCVRIKPLKQFFCDLKESIPFQNKISAVLCSMRSLSTDTTFDPVKIH